MVFIIYKTLYHNMQEMINNYSYDLGVEETKIKMAKKLLKDNLSIEKNTE